MTLKTDSNWASNKTTRPRGRKPDPCERPCERLGCPNVASRYTLKGRRYCSGACLLMAKAGGGK